MQAFTGLGFNVLKTTDEQLEHETRMNHAASLSLSGFWGRSTLMQQPPLKRMAMGAKLGTPKVQGCKLQGCWHATPLMAVLLNGKRALYSQGGN